MNQCLSRTLLSLSLLLTCSIVSAENPTPIIGRVFSYGAGSCCGSFAVSVDLKVKSRSTVEVSFLTGDEVWSIADMVSLDDEGKPNKVVQLMLNCNKKTYSEYDPAHQTSADLRAYRSGMNLKWGDYDFGKVTIFPHGEALKFTSYFEEICERTAAY